MLCDIFCVLTRIVRSAGQPVRWTLHTETAALKDVGIDHRGAHVAVAEEFLDGSDVVAGLQKKKRGPATCHPPIMHDRSPVDALSRF